MKLPSHTLHIEIAQIATGYLVQCDSHETDQPAGTVTLAKQRSSKPVHLKSKEEVRAWLATQGDF